MPVPTTKLKNFNTIYEAIRENSSDNYFDLLRTDKNLLKLTHSNGATLFTAACEFDSKHNVEVFIEEFKVDIKETGFWGRNCFLKAASGGKIDTMKYLHSVDDTLFLEKDDQGYTAPE